MRLPPALLSEDTFLLVPSLHLPLATRSWRLRGSEGGDGDSSWAENEEALRVVFEDGVVVEDEAPCEDGGRGEGEGNTHAHMVESCMCVGQAPGI